MKSFKLLLAGSGILLLTLAGNAQSWTNGLTSYYPFNGNANDLVKTNNGTVQGAVPTSDRYNNPNSAYAFNGSNSAVEIPDVAFNNLAAGTISTWINLDRNTQESIFAKQHPGWNSYGVFTVGYYSASSGAPTDGSAGRLYFHSSNGAITVSSSAVIPTGTWHQVAVTFSSTNCSLYIDGVLSGSALGNFGIPNDNSTITSIGQWGGDVAIGFSGKIDDFRIYNRALTANEMAQLYATENAVCTPHKATATAQVVNGFLVGATITDGGCGYTNAPLVLIQDGGGSGATATATINNGSVISINIVNPGSGYSTNPPPRIVIASPPFVPTVSISFSRVNVLQHVVLGRNYVLESSPDLVTWTATGPQFTALSELVTTEFIINQVGQYFRLREMP